MTNFPITLRNAECSLSVSKYPHPISECPHSELLFPEYVTQEEKVSKQNYIIQGMKYMGAEG